MIQYGNVGKSAEEENDLLSGLSKPFITDDILIQEAPAESPAKHLPSINNIKPFLLSHFNQAK